MPNEIVVALITGACSIAAVVFTNKSANDKLMKQIEVHDAVADTKIEELTREVRKHNSFAERIPVLEEKIKTANHRIADLEDREEKQ